MSCELKFEVQLKSALPQWPTSPSSRFAESEKCRCADSSHFRSAEVTNLNQDLTVSGRSITITITITRRFFLSVTRDKAVFTEGF
jgi:hypothetical protein